MKIIDVIPVSRGITLEKLSYFTSEDVALGSVVTVPLQKRMVLGIVLKVQNAEDSKAQIRSADFQIKKVSKLHAKQFFLPEFIDTCVDAGRYFACSTGSVLSALLPQGLVEQITKLDGEHTDNRLEKIHEKYALQAPDEERFANYKSFIREQFARKASVFFCLPSIHDIEATVPKLERGIEEYIYVLHSEVKSKELGELLKRLLAETHPVVIIATGAFLSVPRRDIGAIIIEKENSRGYKIQARPYLDFRIFAELLAKKIMAKFIVGDLFLQTETMYRHKNGEFVELYPLKFRSLTTSEEALVDMRKYKSQEKNFTVISDEMKVLLLENKEGNENMFVFSARKGLSPVTVCGDCGTIVICSKCQNPVVLHTSSAGGENFFLCHHCGERRKADGLCRKCGGWRLTTLGIGTERVADEIAEILQEDPSKIFTFDKEHIKTQKKARQIMTEFYNSPGSVLIGTEMALLYLDKPVENSAVASIDSFFSVPDFRISEKILGILLRIRGLTQKKMLVQTRDPEQKVFEYSIRGNIMDFYRDEFELRKAFSYPPFSIPIKISLEGKREVIAKEMAHVKELFTEYDLDIFPSFIKGSRGKSILHGLIKVPAKVWPDQKLLDKLFSLPPNYVIKVDPESLL